jgi:hypothetical protein
VTETILTNEWGRLVVVLLGGYAGAYR